MPLATRDSSADTSVPEVSIIMNCLNGEKYLRESLDSVFVQTYDDWEIIFWEDVDSSDNSRDIAKSYGNKLRYFKSDQKLPLYGSRNMAIQKARGRHIAILDCDDIWLPDKLELQVPLLERNPEVGLVFSDCLIFNANGKEKRFFKIVNPVRGMVLSRLLVSNFINTQTVVIRRAALNSIEGPFDGRLHMSGDYDAYLRLSHKWMFDYIDKPLARYRVHANSMTTNEGRRLLASEIRLTIDTLKKTIPDFEVLYSRAHRLMKRRSDIHLSLIQWERRNNKQAREGISVYIKNSIICLGLYLLMFLPFRFVFKPFYRIYTKHPLSG